LIDSRLVANKKEALGMGETNPIDTNFTKEGRSNNR
jgi:flagellar motor protein MotB